MLKHCNCCNKDFDTDDPKSINGICPHCIASQPGLVINDEIVEITNCLDCGKPLVSGKYGSLWGRCPDCQQNLDRQ